MKITHISTLLLSVLSVTEAEWIYSRNGPNIAAKWDTAKVGCTSEATAINEFVNSGVVCLQHGFFSKDKKDKTLALFKNLNNPNFESAVLYLAGYHGSNAGVAAVMRNPNPYKRLALALSDDAIAAIPNTINRDYIRKLMLQLTPTQIQKLNSSVLAVALDPIVPFLVEDEAIMLLNKFSKSFALDHINTIVTLANSPQIQTLWKLSDDVLKALLTNDPFCSKVGGKILSLGPRVAKAKNLNADCSSLIDWTTIVGDRRIRAFQPSVWSKVNKGINPATIPYLSKDALEKYCSHEDDRDERCKDLSIEFVSHDALNRGINAICLANRFTVKSVKLGSKWRYLATDVLSKFTEDSIKNINVDDYKYISTAQKAFVLKSLDACTAVPPEFFYDNGNVEVSHECFNALEDNTKGAALAFAKLPDDILKDVRSIKDWEIKVNSEDYKGFHIFERAQDQPNLKAIIENLSSNTEGSDENACSEIETFEYLDNELHVFKEYCSKACVQAVAEEKTLASFKHMTPRIQALLDKAAVVDGLKDEDWASMDNDVFASVVNDSAVCAKFKIERFNSIPGHNLAEIGADCAAALTLWPSLSPDVYKQFSPDAFSKLSDEQVSHIDQSVLSAEQVEKIPKKKPAAEAQPAATD